MEERKMFKMGEFCDMVFLAFWNTTVDVSKGGKPTWAVFQARRTAPGKAISHGGKSEFSFREKLLTSEEAKKYEKASETAPQKTKKVTNVELSPEVMELCKHFMEPRKLRDELHGGSQAGAGK